MPDIHIERRHGLGMERARAVAQLWVEEAERDYGLQCTYTAGKDEDFAEFGRPGVEGNVKVSADHLELNMKLGFLFDMFSEQIERKIRGNLDELLGGDDAPQGRVA